MDMTFTGQYHRRFRDLVDSTFAHHGFLDDQLNRQKSSIGVVVEKFSVAGDVEKQ